MEGRGSAAGHLAVVAMVLVLVMAPGALAVNHVVGGTTQWIIPSSNSYYDTTWVPTQSFTAGDTLQFEYPVGQHNVMQYNTLAEFNACSGTVVKSYASGNDTVPLPTAGTYYFVCTIPTHCTSGMKVSVVVAAAATPPTTSPTPSPPSTTPSPPAGTPPPPGPSAASSGPVLSMAGLLVAALVATLAFLV